MFTAEVYSVSDLTHVIILTGITGRGLGALHHALPLDEGVGKVEVEVCPTDGDTPPHHCLHLWRAGQLVVGGALAVRQLAGAEPLAQEVCAFFLHESQVLWAAEVVG